MKQNATPHIGTCCSRRQKIWGVVALLGLFACGWMVGVSINNWNAKRNAIAVENVATETMPAVTQSQGPRECEEMEDYIFNSLYATNDDDEKVQFYNLLFQKACPDHMDFINMQYEVFKIKRAKSMDDNINRRLCERVEEELSVQIDEVSQTASTHESNAVVYANLAERGCPENKAKYTELARQEIELMRALSDDILSENDTESAVRIYKRLQMQAAAQDVLDKVQKLTNPAIDFIIEMQQIINE